MIKAVRYNRYNRYNRCGITGAPATGMPEPNALAFVVWRLQAKEMPEHDHGGAASDS